MLFNDSLVHSQDIGAGKGKYYAVNFPLRDGIDDDSYESIFKPVSFIILMEEMDFALLIIVIY